MLPVNSSRHISFYWLKNS